MCHHNLYQNRLFPEAMSARERRQEALGLFQEVYGTIVTLEGLDHIKERGVFRPSLDGHVSFIFHRMERTAELVLPAEEVSRTKGEYCTRRDLRSAQPLYCFDHLNAMRLLRSAGLDGDR